MSSATNLRSQQESRNPVTSRSSSSEGSQDSQPRVTSNAIRNGSIGFLIALAAYASLVLMNQRTPTEYTNVQFDFRTYCPIYYEKNLISEWSHILNNIPGIPKSLRSSTYLNRTYVVIVASNPVDNSKCPNGTAPNGTQWDPSNNPNCHDDLIRYCGLTRRWNETCETGKLQYVCSTPGPVFDLEIYEETYVFWVNNISHMDERAARFPIYDDMRLNACYNQSTPRPHRCTQSKKPDMWQGCQYNDPTNLGDAPRVDFELGPDDWPMSTHVHGLEVRPAFDGNPLSWYTMLAKGVGYLSAEDVYFSKMTEMEANLIRSLFATQNQQVKINIYRNTQLPGSLWYHDHAMSSTGFNVRKGMSGMYLLRNSSLQVGDNKPLPIKKYEQNILIALGSYDVQEGNANGATFSSKKEFESDVWWRMRILNADFNAYYEDLRFVYFDSQGQEIIIPFKVIGADSSLRRTVLSGQTEVSLASAERVDVLIKFESSILPKGSNVYFVQGHDPQDDHYKLFVITVGDICVDPEGINYVPPSTIDVPFTDLSAMPDQNISKIRMRPLMRAWNMDGYGVNGHLLYHKGDSEQPEIGTTEDWYFINGMYSYTIDHPMHVHLINFQEVYEYTLLKMKVRQDDNLPPEDGGPGIHMSFYEMEFYLQPNVSCTWTGYAEIKARYENGTATEADYKKLGSWINDDATVEDINTCFQNFKSENVFDSNRVSSLDVRMQGPTTNYRPTNTGCSMSSHIYLCENITSSLPEYKKGWKETSLVKHGHVMVIRIRWTATMYDPVENGTNYFHIPEKELIEFPGFVYHCHFLQHEDLELMRAIMLQPSAASGLQNWQSTYKQYNTPCLEKMRQANQTKGDLRR